MFTTISASFSKVLVAFSDFSFTTSAIEIELFPDEAFLRHYYIPNSISPIESLTLFEVSARAFFIKAKQSSCVASKDVQSIKITSANLTKDMSSSILELAEKFYLGLFGSVFLGFLLFFLFYL